MTLWRSSLAGIPADPTRYDPVANPRAAKQRRRTVLRTMPNTEQACRADCEPLPERITRQDNRGPGGYFANYVTQQLVDRYKTRGAGGGLRRPHDPRPRAQKPVTERSPLAQGRERPGCRTRRHRPRGRRRQGDDRGSNLRESQFNLAVQGERQAGSSFKPFVPAAAPSRGSPETTFVSKPTTIFLGDRYWPVSNYEDEYLGSANLKTATIHSDNSVYAQLTALVGPENVRREAQQLDPSRLNDYFSIGLGYRQAVNPLEMARVLDLRQLGRRVDGSICNKPRAALGALRRREAPGQRSRPEAGAQRRRWSISSTTSSGVVRQGTGTRGCSATGRAAIRDDGELRRRVVRGYTPQPAVAVWVGYPNNLTPMLIEYEGDAVLVEWTYPAQIWKSFMEAR